MMGFTDGFTHGGIFHADDVFATAFLKMLWPDLNVLRGFSVPENFSGIVYDIGGGAFDHHQKNKRVRANNVPYAAFGLLWEKFGTEILCEEDAQAFDAEFIQPLDLSDNTGVKTPLAELISDRNPQWDESAESDARFWEAVAFAKEILQYRFRRILAERKAYETVRAQAFLCRTGILQLECGMPWKKAVCDLPIYYVIYPSARGGYCVQAVPKNLESPDLKHPFPQAWCGAPPDTLRTLCGMDGINFCHPSGFLCAVETREAAEKLAQLMMDRIRK
jgi:uncharacterized UPF0160 family protein